MHNASPRSAAASMAYRWLSSWRLRAWGSWSYDVLEAPEQAAFARLAVFVGGCSLEAAEVMCQAGGNTLDLIEELVANSLLQPIETTNGQFRLMMLETVREFGLERLARS